MRAGKITIERPNLTPDGGGGFRATGSPLTVYTGFADVAEIKPSRVLEAAQVRLQRGYTLRIYRTAAYSPRAGDSIIYDGERLTIQHVAYTDERRFQHLITALVQP